MSSITKVYKEQKMKSDILLQATRIFFLKSGEGDRGDVNKSEKKKRPSLSNEEPNNAVQFAAVLDQEEIFYIEDVTSVITTESLQCPAKDYHGDRVYFPSLTKDKDRNKQNSPRRGSGSPLDIGPSGPPLSWVDKVKFSPKFARKKIQHPIETVITSDRTGAIQKGSPKLSRKKLQQAPKDQKSSKTKMNEIEFVTSAIGNNDKSEKQSLKQRLKQKALKKQLSFEEDLERKERAESLPLPSDGSVLYVRCNSTPSRTEVPLIRLRRSSDPVDTTTLGAAIHQDDADYCTSDSVSETLEAKTVKQSLLRRLVSPRQLRNFKFPSFGSKSSPENSPGPLTSTKGFSTPQISRRLLPPGLTRAYLDSRRSSAPDLALSEKNEKREQRQVYEQMDYNNNAYTMSPLDYDDEEIRDIARKLPFQVHDAAPKHLLERSITAERNHRPNMTAKLVIQLACVSLVVFFAQATFDPLLDGLMSDVLLDFMKSDYSDDGPASCRSFRDVRPDDCRGALRRSKHFCADHKELAQTFCQRTCSECGPKQPKPPGPSVECKDRRKDCKSAINFYRVSHGVDPCASLPGYTYKYCRKFCGKCQVGALGRGPLRK